MSEQKADKIQLEAMKLVSFLYFSPWHDMLLIWTLYAFHNIASQPYYEGADWLHHSNRNAPEAVTNYSGADLEPNSTTNIL